LDDDEGGVAVSGLEMSQNSMRLKWKVEEVDGRLAEIMADIHKRCTGFFLYIFYL
jgi:glutamate dehydrogenase (NADP+)